MRISINHAERDRAWAEWIAWQLEQAGVEVRLDPWNRYAKGNFAARTSTSQLSADAVVAVFSQAYFEPDRWTSNDFHAVAQVAQERPGFLRPVQIEDIIVPGLLAGLTITKIHDRSAESARTMLLSAVDLPSVPSKEPRRLTSDDDLPDGPARGLRLPGDLPAIWGDVPPRNEAFTGRDGMLVRLREGLHRSKLSIVQALNGAGGVGKTQLAAEYAWRFANYYDAVWWVNAEHADQIGEQYAAFAAALDLTNSTQSLDSTLQILRQYCRTRDRWLIVLDNAASVTEIRRWLLPGPGHLIVTSRDPHWPETAAAVPVDVFARQESIALLRTHLPSMPVNEANQVAEVVGDLPLALAQAAALLAEGMPVAQYLHLIANSAAEALAEGTPVSYPVPLAASVAVAISQVSSIEPAAIQLLHICALFAPDPIPVDWLTKLEDGTLAEPLATTVRAPLAFRRIVRVLNRYGLAKLNTDHDELLLHRLIQQILRDHELAAAFGPTAHRSKNSATPFIAKIHRQIRLRRLREFLVSGTPHKARGMQSVGQYQLMLPPPRY